MMYTIHTHYIYLKKLIILHNTLISVSKKQHDPEIFDGPIDRMYQSKSWAFIKDLW